MAVDTHFRTGNIPYKRGRNHLLLIGIDAYQHVGKLNNAVRDAKAFGQMLQRKYQFEEELVTTIFDEDATRANIASTLRQLVSRVQSGDNLVVYFSGHGHYDEVYEEGYWVPVEARYQAEVDYLSYGYLKKVIKAIPSHHTVFIVDSCYSGAVFVRSKDLKPERFEQDPSRWMVASGRNEVVPDGVAGGNSPFAEHLLDLLDRYCLEGLRLGTLVDKLTTNVSYNSSQTPIGRPMYEVGDKGGEFIFHPRHNQTADYQAAQEAGTAQALSNFLQAYPEFPQKAEVEARIAELQDEEAWAIAKRRDTIQAYSRYRQQQGQGKYRSEALDRIDQLEEARDWNLTKAKHSIGGYERFLDKYPRSAHREEALAAINRLLDAGREPAAWEAARQAHNVEEYERYLIDFPEGAHASQARQAIRQLIQQRAEQEKKAIEEAGRQAEQKRTEQAQAEKERLAREAEARKQQEGEARKKQAEEQAEKERQAKETEDAFWESTQKDHSPAAYQRYLNQYPNGQYQKEAREWRISRERQENLWAKACDKDVPASYKHYIDTYPDPKEPHHQEARSRMAKLEGRRSLGSWSMWRPTKAGMVFLPVLLISIWGIPKIIPIDGQTVHESELPLPRMIRIEGGTFQMGSDDADAYDREKPVHTVKVSSFYLAETEVTFEQYDYFCEQTGRTLPEDQGWGRGNRPVINVSWEDAQAYIQWLNRQPGQSGWRLPTEAEWEYAAGGGASGRTKYAGTGSEGSLENYAVYGGRVITSPVKSKHPNSLGLYDMSGNVWEWCEDKWHDDYQGAPTNGSAWTSGGSSYRVNRGGNWFYYAGNCRVAYRNGLSPTNRNYGLGFRLAR